MKDIKDNSLTEKQQEIKFYLYCEVEYEDNEDIKAVLKSILKDLEAEKC